MNVLKACYHPSLPNSMILIFPDHTVWRVKSGLEFRTLAESDLARLPAYESPAMLKMLLEGDYEIFPFVYFQYGLEKNGMNMGHMMRLNDYAAKVGKAPRSVRQKCQLGTLPGAVKFAGDWMIPADAPYTDNRIKSGEYKNWRDRAETTD